MNCASGSRVRIRGVKAVDIRQQHEAVRARHLRHARGQPVVVAVADLGGGDRVVLVDDRHRAQFEQRLERGARIQVAPAALAVLEREQHLRDRDALLFEQLLVGVRQANLADRGGGLAFLQPQRALGAARAAAARARWRPKTPG